MTRFQLPFAIGMVLAAAGCAQQPVKDSQTLVAQAAHYGVSPELLHQAHNYGYRPQIRHGETVFCRDQQDTGSNFVVTQCIDAPHLQAQLANESRDQRDDQNQSGRARAACYSQSGC